jgi:hypothetical protein
LLFYNSLCLREMFCIVRSRFLFLFILHFNSVACFRTQRYFQIIQLIIGCLGGLFVFIHLSSIMVEATLIEKLAQQKTVSSVLQYTQNKYTSNGLYSFLNFLVFKKTLCPYFVRGSFYIFVHYLVGLLAGCTLLLDFIRGCSY